MFCCSRRAARRQEESERRQDAALSAVSPAASFPVSRQQNLAAEVQPLTHAARSLSNRVPGRSQQAATLPQQPVAVAPPTSSAVSAPEDERTCRVCWGAESEDEPLIRPCGCKGSLTWAHSDCIRQWIDRSKRLKCEVRPCPPTEPCQRPCHR